MLEFLALSGAFFALGWAIQRGGPLGLLSAATILLALLLAWMPAGLLFFLYAVVFGH